MTANARCIRLGLLLGLLLPALSACDKPVAVGDSNYIVVAAPDSVWSALQEEIDTALEPRTFTVRNERIFQVSPVDPRGEDWGDLRNIRQVLVIGEAADPWVADALEEVDGPVPPAPAVVQARNVWAQNQLVTVLLLPPGSSPETASPLIDEAARTLLTQYERYSRARMFVSGADTAAADSLLRTEGFSLLVPTVYDITAPEPGVVVFRNDNPDPSKLIRQIDVAARPRDEVALTPEAALEWRAELAARLTEPVQVTDPNIAEAQRLTVAGNPALEIHGTWSNPPGEWPAGGPFIARLVQCPERTYLLDAWLYAPGQPKYEYMVQLRTLLDSFRCER